MLKTFLQSSQFSFKSQNFYVQIYKMKISKKLGISRGNSNKNGDTINNICFSSTHSTQKSRPKNVALHGDRPIYLKDKEACIKQVQMIAQTQMNNRSHRKVCFGSPVVSSHIFFLGKPHEKLQTD